MARLSFPPPDELSPAARDVYDATAAGRRGRVPANVMVWLRSPELASRAQRLGEFLRFETTLGPRRSELAILVVARHCTSPYEWAIHAREADAAGVPAHVIADIANRRTPHFADDGDRLVFEFSAELMRSHRVPQALYDDAVTALGEQATVELVGLIGYYTLVAMTLNAFEIEPPANGVSPLAP